MTEADESVTISLQSVCFNLSQVGHSAVVHQIWCHFLPHNRLAACVWRSLSWPRLQMSKVDSQQTIVKKKKKKKIVEPCGREMTNECSREGTQGGGVDLQSKSEQRLWEALCSSL